MRVVLGTALLTAFLTWVPITEVGAATQPTVTMQPLPTFQGGGATWVNQVNAVDDYYWVSSMTAHWAVNAPAGVCGQTVTQWGYDYPGAGSSTLVPTNARSFNLSDSTWSEGRTPYQIQVTVTDCNGATASTAIIGVGDFRFYEDTNAYSSNVSYKGTWATAKCTCFSSGTTHYSTRVGDRVTIAAVSRAPLPFALVMAKAADRGSADIFVDGIKKATVNTNSTTKSNHVTVWSSVLSAGSHTVSVVNRATAGHPRIDFDAAVVELTPLPCLASATPSTPRQNSNVDIVTSSAPGANVTADFYFDTSTAQQTAVADINGDANIVRNVGTATVGYSVPVHITVSLGDQISYCEAYFTPTS